MLKWSWMDITAQSRLLNNVMQPFFNQFRNSCFVWILKLHFGPILMPFCTSKSSTFQLKFEIQKNRDLIRSFPGYKITRIVSILLLCLCPKISIFSPWAKAPILLKFHCKIYNCIRIWRFLSRFLLTVSSPRGRNLRFFTKRNLSINVGNSILWVKKGEFVSHFFFRATVWRCRRAIKIEEKTISSPLLTHFLQVLLCPRQGKKFNLKMAEKCEKCELHNA